MWNVIFIWIIMKVRNLKQPTTNSGNNDFKYHFFRIWFFIISLPIGVPHVEASPPSLKTSMEKLRVSKSCLSPLTGHPMTWPATWRSLMGTGSVSNTTPSWPTIWSRSMECQESHSLWWSKLMELLWPRMAELMSAVEKHLNKLWMDGKPKCLLHTFTK